jgi:hypothetical protein
MWLYLVHIHLHILYVDTYKKAIQSGAANFEM